MRATADRPSPAARLAVYAFLAAFAWCAGRGVEWWPLTGWKLFSQLRTGTSYGWQVVTVDGDGDERPLPIDDLPRGYRGVFQIASEFPGLAPADRSEVCAAWAGAVRAAGGEVAGVRVYRTATPVRTDFDAPAPPPRRTERYDC